ncbi:hypothetical protein U3A58_19160 [Algoriphagus sp. C2-6-M1]|nr:hypothetical protein [Algoriphagus sp. C2-6-M1]
MTKFDRSKNNFINFDFTKIFDLAIGSGRALKVRADSRGRVFAGTGLGLSLSYDIIKAHGGEIEVNSIIADSASPKESSTEIILILPIA